MLIVAPHTLLESLGAVLSALIVVLSLIGMTMHGDFYAGICRRDYWAYYTNQSNLLVFVYFALIAPVLYARPSLRALIAHAEYALMLCIMLTHLVFHHFLAPFIAEKTPYTPHTPDARIAHAASIVQHYLVPLLTFAYWLLCSPGKETLNAPDAALWLLFPLLYIAFVFLRARLRGRIYGTLSAYPYPFLDIARFGRQRVFSLCGALCALALALAAAGVLLAHSLFWLLHALFSG